MIEKKIYSKKNDNRMSNFNLDSLVPLYYYSGVNIKVLNSISLSGVLFEPLVIIKMNIEQFKSYISYDALNKVDTTRRPKLSVFDNNKERLFIKLGNQRYKALLLLKYTHADCVLFESMQDYKNSDLYVPTKGDNNFI